MQSKAPRLPARLWQRGTRGALLAFGLWFSGVGFATAADTVTAARYTEPTTRYAHGVLGDDIEYGALEITVESTDPKERSNEQSVLTIRLPQDRVFEDLAPRLSDVDLDGTNEVIVVETSVHEGAQLAIYNAQGEKIAATPHIGTRNRWLAPAGIWDLDNDGQIEIAYVDRPHLVKTLRIWRYSDGKLTEIATLPGLTNHRIGDAFIAGGLVYCTTGPELILASADWSRIISVTFRNGWIKTDLGPLKDRKTLTQTPNC
ncbi:VCBS repeat-containing protein [Ruegeria sp. HKCCA5426]|uniref:FG-GAP repeat domain-containing protein n=1 Tax=Ruegeria sp. HKCCA5426 TaxID=2682985 RepID=UPI0020C1FC8F|nr:VCBS repeat-containing protein [Ruegeria sp. HKCCA5426]